MMRLFLLVGMLLSLVASLVFAHAAAAAADTDAERELLLTDIKEKSKIFHSLTCSFTQERRLALFNQPVVFTGVLAIIRPDHLRWEFRSPIPSVLIFSGDTGLRCTDTTPPVHFDLASDPIMRMVAEQLWTWLNGNYQKLEETYSIELLSPSSLLIRPKDAGVASFIASIAISFTSGNRQPEHVEITEPGGDKTIIRFHDFIFDPRLPASTFSECSVP